MINILKSIFGDNPFGSVKDKNEFQSEHERSTVSSDQVAVATAVICLEMARADSQFSEEEQLRIPRILQRIFDLSGEEVEDILASASVEIEHSHDIWRFTNIINQYFNRSQKKKVIYAMWSIVYADGTLDKHEDYLMHKLSRLLNLSQNDLIEEKLRALQGR